jgi:ribA/ribD-fused uncharacterized protein
MPLEISLFLGDDFFLSNFYEKEFVWRNILWKTSEHAYQWAKGDDSDTVGLEAIRTAPTPGKAKRLGRKVKMRADWEEVKYEIMKDIVRTKFSDPELAQKLLATGQAELIEGNTWGDKTWGCVKENGEWEGRNLLGRILMEIRTELEAKNVKG